MQKPCLHWSSINKAMKERHADLLSMDKIIYTKSLKVIIEDKETL